MSNHYKEYSILQIGVLVVMLSSCQPIHNEHFRIVGNSVYLSQEIASDRGVYTDLIIWLRQNNTKHIKFMLSGSGGSVQSAKDLYFAIQSHDGEVEMVVTGDVYSAHAFLALSGDSVKVVNNNILFLFHIPAILNLTVPEYCSTLKGKSRGVSRFKNCIGNWEVEQAIFNSTLALVPYQIMTKEERGRYTSGYDVYLTGSQIKERLK